jgi:ABC-type branched-subunit amino acid transport system substrate-binding protein
VLVAMGRKKIGIFVQDDAYGTSGRDGVQRALEAHELKLAADTTYPRGMKFDASAAEQVKILREAGVEAVVCVGAYQACAAFVRDARTSGFRVPIHNVSFVGADQMFAILKKAQPAAGPSLLENLLVTQVVPPYDADLPLVREYRAAMEKWKPALPAGVGDGTYRPPSDLSYGSLEGYLSARAFLAILERTGKDLTRRRFYEQAEKLGKIDLGLGIEGELSPARHQLLDKVWFTYATETGWKGTDDPAAVIK